jgi:hypothetical protein
MLEENHEKPQDTPAPTNIQKYARTFGLSESNLSL